MRSALLVILVVGVVGTVAELLLLEHFDGWEQWIPIAALGLAMVGLGWYGITRSRSSVRFVRNVMGASVVMGAVGVVLHLRGNIEFELEIEPTLRGWPLYRAAMMGATPVLAPGAMLQTGLIGMLWSWRHPVLLGAKPPATDTSTSSTTDNAP